MIFLDCGFYSGYALRKWIDAQAVDDSWTIYAFEPNPGYPLKHRLDTFPPINLIRKAVWIKDGTVNFHIGGRDDSASVAGTSGHSDFITKRVKCIDFSKFVSELPDDYIVCSMDIEGAEYQVLEKMLQDKTIDKINELDIEFHHRLMPDKDDDDSRELITQIRMRGVNVRLKEVLV